MPNTQGKQRHFGPEPHYGGGPEAVHAQIHEQSIGKTIACVYLGDDEPIKAIHPEDFPPDGILRSEYLAFEFTDGSELVLQIGSGNSFAVAHGSAGKKILSRA